MKKLFVLGVILTLLAASASAQRSGDRISISVLKEVLTMDNLPVLKNSVCRK